MIHGSPEFQLAGIIGIDLTRLREIGEQCGVPPSALFPDYDKRAAAPPQAFTTASSVVQSDSRRVVAPLQQAHRNLLVIDKRDIVGVERLELLMAREMDTNP